MGRDKVGGDSEEIFGEIVRPVIILTVNHELCASFCEDKLQEVDANSCKSVAVHDHNLCDQSCEYAFQKGLQAMAIEVDSGADVLEELVSRVRFLEVLDLAFEVSALLVTADPCVYIGTLPGRLLSEETQDTIDAIHSLASR